MLEFCPAALLVVDEDGRLLFHNARLRELLGYQTAEIEGIDTSTFWHDLEQRARIIASLRERGGQTAEREGRLADQERPARFMCCCPTCRSPTRAGISASSAASACCGFTTSPR